MNRTLISAENSFIRNIVGIILFVPIIIIAVIVKILILPFERPSKISATEVEVNLRELIEGTEGAWGWDDFTSVPIADPRLDSIRVKVSHIQPPFDKEGLNSLRLLLSEVEELIKADAACSAD